MTALQTLKPSTLGREAFVERMGFGQALHVQPQGT